MPFFRRERHAIRRQPRHAAAIIRQLPLLRRHYFAAIRFHAMPPHAAERHAEGASFRCLLRAAISPIIYSILLSYFFEALPCFRFHFRRHFFALAAATLLSADGENDFLYAFARRRISCLRFAFLPFDIDAAAIAASRFSRRHFFADFAPSLFSAQFRLIAAEEFSSLISRLAIF